MFRPLSNYWKAFNENKLIVTDFDEPVVNPTMSHNLTEIKYAGNRMRPNSVIFKLKKSETCL